MSEQPAGKDVIVHAFRNHLAIILGFSDLMLTEMSQDDPHRKDATEISRAARAALEELESLARKLQGAD